MLHKEAAGAALHHANAIACLQGQNVIGTVVSVGELPIGEEIFGEDIQLIARANMAAAGKLLSAPEDLHTAVAPADIGRAGRRRLILQYRCLREGVIGIKAQLVA